MQRLGTATKTLTLWGKGYAPTRLPTNSTTSSRWQREWRTIAGTPHAAPCRLAAGPDVQVAPPLRACTVRLLACADQMAQTSWLSNSATGAGWCCSQLTPGVCLHAHWLRHQCQHPTHSYPTVAMVQRIGPPSSARRGFGHHGSRQQLALRHVHRHVMRRPPCVRHRRTADGSRPNSRLQDHQARRRVPGLNCLEQGSLGLCIPHVQCVRPTPVGQVLPSNCLSVQTAGQKSSLAWTKCPATANGCGASKTS